MTDSTIETPALTAEIQTITVSGKRMSQALYKQLPIGTLINDGDYSLAGTPWGIVNLHLRGECRNELELAERPCNSAHGFHVIFTDYRGRLTRTCIAKYPDHVEPEWTTESDAFLTACVWETLTGDTRWFKGEPLKPKANYTGRYEDARRIVVMGYERIVSASDAAVNAWTWQRMSEKDPLQTVYASGKSMAVAEALEIAKAKLSSEYGEIGESASELHRMILDDANRGRDYLDKMNQTISQLLALPQLFIGT